MNPYLVADPDLTNLLFIIAYRDDEVDKDENKAAPERIYRDNSDDEQPRNRKRE